MASGFILADTIIGSDGWVPKHARGNWFAEGVEWAITQNDTGSDWFVHKKDGATPGTAGTEGGWTETAWNPNTKNTAGMSAYYSATEEVVALYVRHATNDDLIFGDYNGTSEEFEQVGSTLSHGYGKDLTGDVVIGHDGRCHVFRISSGLKAKATNTARTSLGSEVTIHANGTGMASPCIFTDGTDWYVGVLCADATLGDYRFAYCKDGDDPSDALNWTVETVALVSATKTPDEHGNLVSYVASGDSASTIVACTKDSGHVVRAARVKKTSASTSWDSAVTAGTTKTRPQVAIDETNDEVYIAYLNSGGGGSATAVEYVKSDAATLSFGSATTLIEDTGTENFLYVSGPSTVCNSTTGMTFVAFNADDDETWYGEVTIAGGSGVSLTGSTSSTGSVDGDLDADASLSGSTSSSAATDGAIDADASLSGATSSTGSTSGALSVSAGVSFTGATSSSSSLDGAIDADVALAGSTDSTGSASGAISTGTGVSFTGTIACSGSTAAAIDADVDLAGSASGSGSAAGALTVTSAGAVFSGSVSGAGSLTVAQLDASVSISGSTEGTGVLSGPFSTDADPSLAGTIHTTTARYRPKATTARYRPKTSTGRLA